MNFNSIECVLVQSRYMNNDNLALILKDKYNMGGAPIAVVTVNTDEKLPADQAYVKDYSENTGMMKSLEEAGLIKEILREKQSGFVTLTLVKFNLDGIKIIK